MNSDNEEKINPFMKIDVKNILIATSLFGPYFLIGFLILLSFINNDIKVLLYLSGIFFIFISRTLFENNPKMNILDYNAFCNVLGYEQHLSINSSIYSYTFTYLIMPMIDKSNYNFGLLSFLFILYFIDIITKLQKKCFNVKSILLGTILGFMIGFFLFILLSGDKNSKQYLYYDTLSSNKVACMRPTKQKFKCNVLRNGEIITTIN